MISLILLFIFIAIDPINSFLSLKCARTSPKPSVSSTHVQLYRIPRESLPNIYSDTGWSFHLLELKDLNLATDLTSECFYKPRIVLDTNNMNRHEINIWSKVLELYQTYDKFDFRMNNYWGFRTRSGQRLRAPSLNLSHDSFILVATTESEPREVVGLVEICLEMPNGKLAPPVKFPFFNSPPLTELEPYLCNLCVNVKYRRRKLGQILCKISESLVKRHWKKNSMYLHVEEENLPAKKLYLNMGYSITDYDMPFWEAKLLGLDKLLYFRRSLDDLDERACIENKKQSALVESENIRSNVL
jgi:ribosomal protein S18 acetylase RimI-like enzyme